MKHRSSTTAAALLVVLLAGTAVAVGIVSQPADACSSGTVSRLYLGQNTPTGVVAEEQWRRFVAEAVAVRFPGGFTEFTAYGHWRDASGRTLAEQTRIVEIAHSDLPAERARVRAIAADYRARFAQESVLVTQLRSLQCFDTGA